MAAAMAAPSFSARHTSFAGASVRVTARTGAMPARVPVRIEAGESRIGKEPIKVPKGVTYTLENNHLKVKVRPLLEPVCIPSQLAGGLRWLLAKTSRDEMRAGSVSGKHAVLRTREKYSFLNFTRHKPKPWEG